MLRWQWKCHKKKVDANSKYPDVEKFHHAERFDRKIKTDLKLDYLIWIWFGEFPNICTCIDLTIPALGSSSYIDSHTHTHKRKKVSTLS